MTVFSSVVRGLVITWLILACVNVEGRREIRLLIAVVPAEFLSEDKAFFYTVLVTLFKWVINPYCLSYPGSRVILSEFIESG